MLPLLCGFLGMLLGIQLMLALFEVYLLFQILGWCEEHKLIQKEEP